MHFIISAKCSQAKSFPLPYNYYSLGPFPIAILMRIVHSHTLPFGKNKSLDSAIVVMTLGCCETEQRFLFQNNVPSIYSVRLRWSIHMALIICDPPRKKGWVGLNFRNWDKSVFKKFNFSWFRGCMTCKPLSHCKCYYSNVENAFLMNLCYNDVALTLVLT